MKQKIKILAVNTGKYSIGISIGYFFLGLFMHKPMSLMFIWVLNGLPVIVIIAFVFAIMKMFKL